jgi:hypothetical protein
VLGGEHEPTGKLASWLYPCSLSSPSPHVKRRMFALHCENIVRAATRNRIPESQGTEAADAPTLASRIAALFHTGTNQYMLLGSRENSFSRASNIESPRGNFQRVRPHMIRRIDDAPKLVDPSGWISEGQAGPINVPSMHPSSDWESSPSTGPKTWQHSLVQKSRSLSPTPPASHESRVGRSQERS